MAKQVKKRESSAQNADDSRAFARGGNRRAGRDYRDESEDGNSAPRRDAPRKDSRRNRSPWTG